MISCIPIINFKDSPEIQKDFNLDDLLRGLKYFPSSEEAVQEGYVPIHIAMSVRTCATNLVVTHDEFDENSGEDVTDLCYKFYSSANNIPEGATASDFVMLVSAHGLLDMVDLPPTFFVHSNFSLIGLYSPDRSVCDPMIVTHIIFKDMMVDILREHLKEGYQLTPIDEVSDSGNIFSVLVEQLVHVEGGDTNGKSES